MLVLGLSGFRSLLLGVQRLDASATSEDSGLQSLKGFIGLKAFIDRLKQTLNQKPDTLNPRHPPKPQTTET